MGGATTGVGGTTTGFIGDCNIIVNSPGCSSLLAALGVGGATEGWESGSTGVVGCGARYPPITIVNSPGASCATGELERNVEGTGGSGVSGWGLDAPPARNILVNSPGPAAGAGEGLEGGEGGRGGWSSCADTSAASSGTWNLNKPVNDPGLAEAGRGEGGGAGRCGASLGGSSGDPLG
jgi:hypothetical protein